MFYKLFSAASLVLFYIGAGALQFLTDRPNEFIGTALALMGLAITIVAQLRAMRANAREALMQIALYQMVVLALCYGAMPLTGSPHTAQAQQNFVKLAAALLTSNVAIACAAGALDSPDGLSLGWEFFAAALLLHLMAVVVRTQQPFGLALPVLHDQYLAWHAACFFQAQLTLVS